MRERIPLLVLILFILLFTSACNQNAAENGDYPYGHYEDDKMIGKVQEVNKTEIIVDVSEWEKRDRKGPDITDEGYSYIAKITDGTVIKYENGTEASIVEIKKGQKVLVNPPRGNDFEGHDEEIILLGMTYKEKYSRLLSHVDGFNIVVMYQMGEKVPNEMQEQMYEKILNILKGKEKSVVAAWMEYDEDYVVDYKEELDIQQFPVILVFNKEALVLKAYKVDELFAFFKK